MPNAKAKTKNERHGRLNPPPRANQARSAKKAGPPRGSAENGAGKPFTGDKLAALQRQLADARAKHAAAVKKLDENTGRKPVAGAPKAAGFGALINQLVYDKKAKDLAAEVKRREAFVAAHKSDPIVRASHPTLGSSAGPKLAAVALGDGRAVGAAMETKAPAVVAQSSFARTTLGNRFDTKEVEVTRHVSRDHVDERGEVRPASWTVVRHSEYVRDIVCVGVAGTPTPFQPVQDLPNPGNTAFAAWLATFAANFEEYVPERIRFEHRTEAGSGVSGRQGGVCDYNVLDATPPSKIVFYSTNGAVAAAVWENMGVEFRRVPGGYNNSYFVGPVAAGADPMMYTPFTYNTMTQDVLMPASGRYTVAELHVSYEFWFMEPTLENTGSVATTLAFQSSTSGTVAATGQASLTDLQVTATNPLVPSNWVNASRVPNPANSPAIVFVPPAATDGGGSGGRISFPNAQATYLVSVGFGAVNGTQYTAAVPAASGPYSPLAGASLRIVPGTANTTASIALTGAATAVNGAAISFGGNTSASATTGAMPDTFGSTPGGANQNKFLFGASAMLTVVPGTPTGSGVQNVYFDVYLTTNGSAPAALSNGTAGIPAGTLLFYSVVVVQLPRALYGWARPPATPGTDWVRRSALVSAKRVATLVQPSPPAAGPSQPTASRVAREVEKTPATGKEPSDRSSGAGAVLVCRTCVVLAEQGVRKRCASCENARRNEDHNNYEPQYDNLLDTS